jgi:hypothetical protein
MPVLFVARIGRTLDFYVNRLRLLWLGHDHSPHPDPRSHGKTPNCPFARSSGVPPTW